MIGVALAVTISTGFLSSISSFWKKLKSSSALRLSIAEAVGESYAFLKFYLTVISYGVLRILLVDCLCYSKVGIILIS